MGDTIKSEKKPCPKCGELAQWITIKSYPPHGESISTKVICKNPKCGETVYDDIGRTYFFPNNPTKSRSEMVWDILKFLFYLFWIFIIFIIIYIFSSIFN